MRDNCCLLQLCPVCRGFKIRTLSSPLSRLKPCRGYCHNVIMGCFSKLLEISGDWDDVVVAFQNLEVITVLYPSISNFSTPTVMDAINNIVTSMVICFVCMTSK